MRILLNVIYNQLFINIPNIPRVQICILYNFILLEMIITKLLSKQSSPDRIFNREATRSTALIKTHVPYEINDKRVKSKLSHLLLPFFADFAPKQLPENLYSKFTVNELIGENKKISKFKTNHTSANRSQKVLNYGKRNLEQTERNDQNGHKVDEKISESEVQSYFRGGKVDSFLNLKEKQKGLRPQTAKKNFDKVVTIERNFTRPNTATKSGHKRTSDYKKYKNQDRQTNMMSEVTNSRLMTKNYIEEKVEEIKEDENQTQVIHKPSMFRKDVSIIEDIKDDDIELIHKEQAQVKELIEAKVSGYEKYLKENNKQLYKKYQVWQQQNAISQQGKKINQQGQLQQINLEVAPKTSDQVHRYFHEVVERMDTIEENLNKINLKVLSEESLATLNDEKIDLLDYVEYETLCRQLRKPKNSRNIESVEGILTKFTNFKILTKERRIAILRMSELVFGDQEKQILSENSKSQFIFLIIKGSVEKRYCRTICKVQKQVIQSLYDGEMFGNSESEDSQQIRYSVVCKEPCTFIKISANQYSKVQSQFLQSQLFYKIKALRNITSLDKLMDKELIPLANLLKEKKVYHGQLIIKEGDQSDEFYIFTEGMANIIKEQIVIRKKKDNNQINAKHQFFHCNSIKSLRKPKPIIQSSKNIRYDKIDQRKNKKNYNMIAEDKLKIAYQYHHKYRQLNKGDKLMYRAILKGLDEYQNVQDSKAKLSVIAASNSCTFFTLSSNDIKKIPDYLLKILIAQAKSNRDFDDFFNQQQNLMLKKWDKYKMDLCDQILSRRNR